MKYIVRTISWDERRLRNVEILCQRIPLLEVLVDPNHDGFNTFLQASALLNTSGGILLEDDVAVCRNFTHRIEQVVHEKNQDVINFFERPKKWLPTAYLSGSQFLWMQCTYIPPGLHDSITTSYKQYQKEEPKEFKLRNMDTFFKYVLKTTRRRYWRIRPCLVQHLDFKSSLGHRPSNRQSPYFIDDLEQQGVSYDDLRPSQQFKSCST